MTYIQCLVRVTDVLHCEGQTILAMLHSFLIILTFFAHWQWSISVQSTLLWKKFLRANWQLSQKWIAKLFKVAM